jgi:hypothetical protein
MSLINDALKRASQTAKDRPAQAEVPAPMQPVPEPPASGFNLMTAAGPAVVILLAVAGWILLQRFYLKHAPPGGKQVVAGPAVAGPRVGGPAQVVAGTQGKTGGAAGTVGGQVSGTGTGVKQGQAAGGVPAARAATGGTVAAAGSGAQNRTAVPPAATPAAAVNAARAGVVVAQQPAAVATVPTPVPVPVNTYRPPVSSPGAFPKLQVKGIFYNRSKPYALINGETLGEGEHILGVTIKQILPNRVVLELNGQTKQLVLGE